MSKSKPLRTLPTLPASIQTLPNGDLDCNPELPDPGGVMAELERMVECSNADILLRERRRSEELDHERAKAEIRAQAQASPRSKKRPALPDTSRSKQIRGLIKRDAEEAGRDNELFCEFLDRDHVQIDPTWGARSWSDAWAKKKLHLKIRAFKSYWRRSVEV
jgi:hypothetical protein